MTHRIPFIVCLLLAVLSFSAAGAEILPPGVAGHLPTKEELSRNPERKSVLRESEIIGTLENPRLSTEIPWHNPELPAESNTGLRKSFSKEIFRQIRPSAGEGRK